jgi:hypothetical protein
MSFTSRDLRGWFHTFTSLPLVHTPNPDFWGNVFDLASFWFLNPSFTTPEFRGFERIISQVRDSRASPVDDSRFQGFPDSRLPRESYIPKQIESSNTSRDGSFTRGHGYPRVPDPTGADMGSKICPRVRVRASKSARGQLTGCNLYPRVYPLPASN